MEKKDDDSLPQKNVPYHDDRFIHRCRVRLGEDNQLHMLPSICPLIIKEDSTFFSTHSLMLDSREKEREQKNSTATLRFYRWREKEKCLLYHPVEEMKNLYLKDHSLEHRVLKTSWLASKVRSSARRRRWERKQREEQYRTFLTSLRCQDLPSCSCDSRSIQLSFNIFYLRQNWTWRTRREEIVPYLSFPQSSASSASQETGFVKRINARKNIFNTAW